MNTENDGLRQFFFAVIGEQRAAFNARDKANTYVVTPHD